MGNIRGKITNPITLGGNIISETDAPINLSVETVITYQSSSTSTFLETNSGFYFPTDLSNIDNIFVLSYPYKFGYKLFSNNITEQTLPLYFSGTTSDPEMEITIKSNNDIRYIDGGKKYQLYSSRYESLNFDNEPISNSGLYSYVERSDFDSFDFPQVTIRGTRKIPLSADTLCGPIYYSGYTYDRLNYNWFFGDYAGITFNPIQSGGTPYSITGSVISVEGVSSISNQEGSTLFYTNGETVYTSGNTVMSNGTGLPSSGTSTQSSIIVPKVSSNKYYIFTTDYNGSSNGFYYSIVNMDSQSGNGQVETKNIKLISSPTTEKVTSTSHNTEGYWVITHTSGDTNYYSYLLNSSGLNSPVITSIGTTHTTPRGYMKTSPDNSKLISLLYDQEVIDIFDFDNSTGVLSNHITITGKTYDVGPYGLEFSSDSSKFYVTEGAGEKIYQFDLTYTGGTDILENIIEIASISGSSLGALQMGPDERIYVADYGSEYLHIIHRPNGLGVQCNFQENDITLSGGTYSNWGLPNIINSKSISPDRYVYITSRDRIGFFFDITVNNINDVIIPFQLSMYGEIYKYNQTDQVFDSSSLSNFTYTYEELSGETGNTIYIPSVSIGEGEFIIKTYWDYNVNTLISKQQEYRRSSVDTYKRGSLYGLYNSEIDWYFINMFDADVPLFNNNISPPPSSINQLTVISFVTESGVTEYNVVGLTEPLVSYNGSVLLKDTEYSANTTGTTTYVELLFTPLEDQILTVAYVTDGSTDGILVDGYTISSTINSGATGTQTSTDRVYYNTTESKYEFYLVSSPVSDVILTINGSVLSNNIEYYISTSDSRRIILVDNIVNGDIIQGFYTPENAILGPIETNQPIFNWSITSSPITTEGIFTVQITTPSDTNFLNIVYSGTVDYVIGQKSYSTSITLTNAVAGDNFIYRIKNEKFYTPIYGEIIYSVKYSDVNEIEIISNSGNSY
jgi:hypothetical protein